MPADTSIFVLDILCCNTSTPLGPLSTFRMATHSLTTAPGDSPANTFYDGRLTDAGTLQRTLFANGGTIGKVGNNYGYFEFNNADGALDQLLNYAFDGYPFTLRQLASAASPVSSAPVVFKGTMRGIDTNDPRKAVRLRIRDLMDDLSVPFLTQIYAGSTLSTGATAEGDANLAGQYKPQLWGFAEWVEPKLVNAFDLIYQVGTNPQFGSFTVYDGGVALSPNVGDFSTIAALRSATIAAGGFATCKALGLFRLGAAAAFVVTASATSSALASPVDARTPGAVAKQMLLQTVPGGNNPVDTASFDALDTLAPYGVGTYVTDGTSIADAVNAVLNSVGATLVSTAQGQFRCVAFGRGFANTPVDTFTDRDIGAADAVFALQASPQAEGDGVPPYRVVVGYRKVWRTMSKTELAGSNSQSAITFFATQFRQKLAQFSVNAHLTPWVMTVNTLLNSSTDAPTEAIRLLLLYGVRRDYLTVSMSADRAGSIELGDIANVQLARLGYDAGKPFQVIGRTDYFGRRRVLLNLFG